MKRNPPPSADEAIEATAAAWLAERETGLAPEDELAYAAWLEANPRHAAAMARISKMWDALRLLHDFRPEGRTHPDPDLLRPRAERHLSFPAAAGLAAAAALVVALSARFLSPTIAPARPAQAFATTTEGYQRVSLADGSVLELNSDTEVSVRLLPNERQVRLLRGEAHFKVAKDAARPFRVEAGVVSVRAVGTAFDIRLASGKVEVLVTEGRVRVGSATAARGTPVGVAAGPAPSFGCDLAANQLATVALGPSRPGAPTVEDVDPREVGARLAWQEPRLVFVDTPLAQAVAQFNLRNRAQILIADPDLASMPIVGTFRSGNEEAFVRLIATSDNGIAADRPDADHIVLRRGK